MARGVILVVEDNPLNLELVRDILTIQDYDVLEATTAQEATDMVIAGKPDLVIMDIQLPGIDGLALTRMLKSDPKTRDVIVVALTAHAMKGDEAKAYAAGCSGYISKPIDTRTFPIVIAQFLAIRHRASASLLSGDRPAESSSS